MESHHGTLYLNCLNYPSVALAAPAPPVVLNRLPERPKMFEVGKTYVGRYGSKGKCLFVTPDGKGVLEFQDGSNGIYKNDGRWSEYTPPVVRTAYMNLYPGGFSVVYETKERADRNAALGRVGCQKITLTEGTWDD